MSESVTRLNQGQAPIAGPSQPQPAANGPGALNAALRNARIVAAHTPARVAAGPTRQATRGTVASSLEGLVSGQPRGARSKASDIMQHLPARARTQEGLNNIAQAIDECRDEVGDLLHLNRSDADATRRIRIRAALLMLLAEGYGVQGALDSKDAIVGREIAEHNAATALQRCLDRFDFSSRVSTTGAMEIIRELPAAALMELGLQNISDAVARDADGVKEVLNFNGRSGTPQQLLRVRAELVAMLAQGKDLSALQARKQELSAFLGFVTELKGLVSGRGDTANAKVDAIIKCLPAEAMAGQGVATISDAIAKDRRRVDTLLHFPNKGSDAYRLDARVDLLARLANGDGLDKVEKVKAQKLAYLNLLETLTSLVSGHRDGATAEQKAEKIMIDLRARGVDASGFEKISAAISTDRRRVDNLLHFNSYQGSGAGDRAEARVDLLMEIANGRGLDEAEKVKKTKTAASDLVEDLTTIVSVHVGGISARQKANQIVNALRGEGVDYEGMEKISAAIAASRRGVQALLHFGSHQGSDDDRVRARAELLQVFAQNGGLDDATRHKAQMLSNAGVNDAIHLANRPVANVVRISAVAPGELGGSTSANPARPKPLEIPRERSEAVLKRAFGIHDSFPLDYRNATDDGTVYRIFYPDQVDQVAHPESPATGTDYLVTSGRVMSLPVVVFWKAHGGQQMATLFHLPSVPPLKELMDTVSNRGIASVDSISFVGRRNDRHQDRSGAVVDRLTQLSKLTGIPVQIIETQVFAPKVAVDVQGAKIFIMEEDRRWGRAPVFEKSNFASDD